MLSDVRTKRAFVVVISLVVVVLFGLCRSRAVAQMYCDQLRCVILEAVSAVSGAAEFDLSQLPGETATPTQAAGIVQAALQYWAFLRDADAASAWHLTAPESRGAWDWDAWEANRSWLPNVEEGQEFRPTLPLLALGTEHQIVSTAMQGASGWAHVIAQVEYTDVTVLQQAGQLWKIDLEATEALNATHAVHAQLRAGYPPTSGATHGESAAILAEMAEITGEPSYGPPVGLRGLPLYNVSREVVAVNWDGERGYAAVRTTGTLSVAVTIASQGGDWDVVWEAPFRLVPPDATLASMDFVQESFAAIRRARAAEVCMSNMHTMGIALLSYASDYDDTCPSARTWCNALAPYLPNDRSIHHCPEDDADYSYAMNYKLSGVPMSAVELPNSTIALFESELGVPNAHDFPGPPGDSLADPPRHGDEWYSYNHFAFADGSVQSLNTHEVFFDLYRLVKEDIWYEAVPEPLEGP